MMKAACCGSGRKAVRRSRTWAGLYLTGEVKCLFKMHLLRRSSKYSELSNPGRGLGPLLASDGWKGKQGGRCNETTWTRQYVLGSWKGRNSGFTMAWR